MRNETLLVNRKDFGDVALAGYEMDVLEEGCLRVEVGPFALTANNITYMVTGDQIGYWRYFAPENYGLGGENHMGRMPVWGYGRVSESRCDDVAVGAQIYGFFPIAKFIDICPAKINGSGFSDVMEHRQKLHPIYNRYSFTDGSGFSAHRDLQPLLRPLFTTSFLLDDFMAQNQAFGAEQILLLSASSKTALGTAFCLRKNGQFKTAGLTSASNKAFVEQSGFYGQVEDYDSLTDLDSDVKTAIIDMAGNGDVLARLYEHFEENIVYNCMVGKSHWNGAHPPKPNLGTPPIMFFAPDYAKKRIGEIGATEFDAALSTRFFSFCDDAARWMNVAQIGDVSALLTLYKDLLNGQADPTQSQLFSL